MHSGLPVVCIVGRPNVGKSSLFNLILGERKSIVHETEGVTRDINMARARAGSAVFFLYDTAGYLEEGDSFNDLVREKVLMAIKDTDLVLFMVDGRNYHTFDEALARLLIRSGKKVLVIANKLDNRAMEDSAAEFYNLGFSDIIPFSVAHKRGYYELLERIEDSVSGVFKPEDEDDSEIRIAIVGRPNVGKSRLVNTILGYDRSIVSETAGTTRDSLDDVFKYSGKVIRLIDTAGLRKKSKVEPDVEYFSNVRAAQAVEHSHVVVQLLDGNEVLSQQDKRITEMVIRKRKALVLAYNKWDLVRKEGDENYFLMEDMRKKLYEELPSYKFIPVEFISGAENYRIKKLLETSILVYNYYIYRVPTSRLNEWIDNEIRESISKKKSSNLRIYYGTQVYAAPPQFVFFVNDKSFIKKDYPRFIENKLREAFVFEGVPIKVTFRERGKSEPK